MNKALLLSLTLIGSLAMAGLAIADDDDDDDYTPSAQLVVVHGINGMDLGEHEALPVDIAVNGECTDLVGVPFRTISEPIPFESGLYKVEVFLANEVNPCHGPLAATQKVSIQFGENAALVAHLTEQGTPTLTKFVNDVRATDHGEARLIVRHTAAAPPVEVAGLEDIRNGEQRSAEVELTKSTVTINPFGEEPVGPITLDLMANSSNIVYAVGSLKNGTFEPLTQVINTVAGVIAN